MNDKVLNKKLQHTVVVHATVSRIRSNLNFETLTGPLKGADELHGIIRMHVIVGSTVVDKQSALEFGGIVHGAAGFVTFFVLLWYPHIALGVNRVVVIPGGYRR